MPDEIEIWLELHIEWTVEKKWDAYYRKMETAGGIQQGLSKRIRICKN